MIIEELTLKNFLAIFGKQTIKFPVKNQSSITIIIAPNNAGKTSIIRALHFLFYGFDTIEREKKAVNFEKISKSTIHNTIETYVEAVVFNAGRRYRVKRTLKANKLTEENIQVDIFDKKLSMIEHKKREDMPYEDTIMMENILKQMVPKGLFDFFFFKGEELAEKLVDPDSRDVSIFEGLSEILYQDKWNNTVSTLKSAVKAFDTKFRKASGQSEEVIRLQHRKDEYTEGNDTLRAAQKNAKKEAENKRKEYESLDQQVINSIPERNNTVKEKLSQLKRLINKNQNQIDDLSDIIKKAVGGSGGVYYLNNAFSEAYEVLNKLQDDKLLPPDISESILCSILDDKLCLCGTHLVEGTPERKKIEKLRARALAESLSNELYTLYCTLKESNCRGYQAERNKIVTSIKENSLKLDKAIEELASSEDEYKMIEKDYDKHADVTYKNLKKRRDLALNEYHEVRDRFKGIERKLQENQYELQKINQQLRGIKSIPKHARKLQICAFFATKILTAVEKIHDDLQSSYWTFLQENVSKLYEEIVTDQSRAVIDKRTLLPVIERAGIRGLSLGGGQQQTLVLAYIMALSELRKKVNNQLRKYFSLKTVDDQCFFMDSVFAPMQPEYRFKVATALPGKMKQLVLLVAPQQWDTSVSKSLKGSIDAAYRFLIKTNKPIKGKDYFLDFYGTECKLVENVKNKIHSYTEILSLEV